MPTFIYKGLDKQGRFLQGTLDSENLKTAKITLKKQGVFLQDIQNKTHQISIQIPVFQKNKIPTKDLAIFTRLLASLLRAGIPLVEALNSIFQQTANKHLAFCISSLRDQINEGKSFYLSLKTFPHIFDSIYISLCESGEASGTLDIILEQVAVLMEKRSAIRNKVLMALFYPGILFIIALVVMLILCVYVIPNLMDLFEDIKDLPWMTKVTLAFSQFLLDYWLALIVAIVSFSVIFTRWIKSSTGKKYWDAFLLSVPVFGRLIRTADIAMFSKTFATLLKGGVSVLKSMNIVKNVVSNSYIRLAIEKAKDNMKEGGSLSEPLKESGQFSPVILQMIQVGETTGELENMLEQISESYDRQIDIEVSAMTALLGPIMILIMALIIAFILISALLPMLDSLDSLDV